MVGTREGMMSVYDPDTCTPSQHQPDQSIRKSPTTFDDNTLNRMNLQEVTIIDNNTVFQNFTPPQAAAEKQSEFTAYRVDRGPSAWREVTVNTGTGIEGRRLLTWRSFTTERPVTTPTKLSYKMPRRQGEARFTPNTFQASPTAIMYPLYVITATSMHVQVHLCSVLVPW
jgi:hypothetical protein